MDADPILEIVRNIDTRVSAIEQILPTLATKAELQAAIAPLATKAELQAALEPLATKTEMREEGSRTRAHFDVVAERMEDRLRLIAEGHIALDHRMDAERRERKADIQQLDVRVSRLETKRPK